MAEPEPTKENDTCPLATTKTKRNVGPKSKRQKINQNKEDIQNDMTDNHEEQKDEENSVKNNSSIENQDWQPLVFPTKDETMLPLHVVVEYISTFEPERKQHFLFLAHDLSLRNLTHTVLNKVGFRNLDKLYTFEGRLQIGSLKPLTFSTITDNLDDSIENLFKSIISNVILYIKVKKILDDTNEEERLNYQEVRLIRGTGYLINDYFYVSDRQSDRKDVLYLRCNRQRQGNCPSRARILRELGCAVLANKNHNHPPPNVHKHEFMHRCRNDSRDPKKFSRNLKDIYDEICEDVLNCSDEQLSEAQQAVQDWDSVKKIMQKCRSRGLKLHRANLKDSDSLSNFYVMANKSKRMKMENDTPDNSSRTEDNSTNQEFISLRDTTFFSAVPQINLPSGNSVPLMVDGVRSEPLPVNNAHQTYNNSQYHMNTNWTTTENFMVHVQTSSTN
ncbi:uncharacterized protein [Antedon mediterranea]|uniref:uncharacterized protein isoform X2 n=1 Tax=Antedon mediterranea TaxID=105859 RepID=UPI003AF86867